MQGAKREDHGRREETGKHHRRVPRYMGNGMYSFKKDHRIFREIDYIYHGNDYKIKIALDI